MHPKCFSHTNRTSFEFDHINILNSLYAPIAEAEYDDNHKNVQTM